MAEQFAIMETKYQVVTSSDEVSETIFNIGMDKDGDYWSYTTINYKVKTANGSIHRLNLLGYFMIVPMTAEDAEFYMGQD